VRRRAAFAGGAAALGHRAASWSSPTGRASGRT
jgi:hypothetical protein